MSTMDSNIQNNNNEEKFPELEKNQRDPASLKSELEECKKKCEEYLNNWKRERADFLNYKKEEAERMIHLAKYEKEDMILEILPILDNIYLAEKQLPEHLKKGEKGSQQAIEWTKGFIMIKKQIEEFLKQQGVEEIKTESEKFNPETMEAIGNTEGGDEGIMIEELQKGYIMNGKVLRPAKVKISK